MVTTEFKSKNKRIYFHNLEKLKWSIVPLILGLLLLLSDLFNWFEMQGNGNWSGLGLIGQLLIYVTLLVLISPYLFRRYVVQWNEIGMQLKVDSFFGTYIPFSEVTSLEIHDDSLKIFLLNGKERKIDVSHILEEDIDKLMKVIKGKIRNG